MSGERNARASESLEARTRASSALPVLPRKITSPVKFEELFDGVGYFVGAGAYFCPRQAPAEGGFRCPLPARPRSKRGKPPLRPSKEHCGPAVRSGPHLHAQMTPRARALRLKPLREDEDVAEVLPPLNSPEK